MPAAIAQAGGRYVPHPMSIPRATLLALAVCAALAGGCGGEPASDEDKATEVATEYVSTHANSDEAKCAQTLAAGVDPKLCDDLGPLASRVNPEKKSASVSGSTATVTVTGAGNNTEITVSLVKEGDDWRVKSWKGQATQ